MDQNTYWWRRRPLHILKFYFIDIKGDCEYRDVNPEGLSYSRFCEHYRAYTKTITPVMRQIHKGGEKTFVDYAGMTVPWLDPMTGEVHDAQIFVGALGASQLIFVEATATQTLPDWIQSHIHMWEYFGGVNIMVLQLFLRINRRLNHYLKKDITMQSGDMQKCISIIILFLMIIITVCHSP